MIFPVNSRQMASKTKMDQTIIYMEEGNCETNRNEPPQIANALMCLAAIAMLTIIGLIQYSAIVLAVDE